MDVVPYVFQQFAVNVCVFPKFLFGIIFLLKFRTAKDKLIRFNIFIPIQIYLIRFAMIIKQHFTIKQQPSDKLIKIGFERLSSFILLFRMRQRYKHGIADPPLTFQFHIISAPPPAAMRAMSISSTLMMRNRKSANFTRNKLLFYFSFHISVPST